MSTSIDRHRWKGGPLDHEQLLDVFKALAEPNRLRMVQVVGDAGELACGEVVRRFDLAQATVSHHLKLLVNAGVLLVRREAQFTYFSVNPAVLADIRRALGDVLVTPKPSVEVEAAEAPDAQPSKDLR